MKKLFMLSEGDYSDYCVSGLYESELDLSEDKLKELRCDYGETIGICREITVEDHSIDDYILERHYKELIVGRKKPKYHVGQYDSYREQSRTYEDEYKNSGKAVKIDFIKWLKSKEIIKEVEYEEIHTCGH